MHGENIVELGRDRAKIDKQEGALAIQRAYGVASVPEYKDIAVEPHEAQLTKRIARILLELVNRLADHLQRDALIFQPHDHAHTHQVLKAVVTFHGTGRAGPQESCPRPMVKLARSRPRQAANLPRGK